jgi:hypothetical protein
MIRGAIRPARCRETFLAKAPTGIAPVIATGIVRVTATVLVTGIVRVTATVPVTGIGPVTATVLVIGIAPVTVAATATAPVAKARSALKM